MDSLRRRAGSAVHALRVSIPCPLPGSWSRCVPLFPPANPPPPCLALVLAAGEGTARAGRHLSLLHCARLRPSRQRFGRTPLTRLSGVECVCTSVLVCVSAAQADSPQQLAGQDGAPLRQALRARAMEVHSEHGPDAVDGMARMTCSAAVCVCGSARCSV